MSHDNIHHDWLSLIEISGPFLAVPVLKEAFPQGLEELDSTKRKRLRQAYEEWREALELEDEHFAELHVAWTDEVLSRGLELDEDGKGDVLKRADWCAANLQATLPEHGATLSPNLAVVDEQRASKPLLLIQTYSQDVDLDATMKQNGWAATPADRMVTLCRALGCRLGLVTNGERWMLVDAPVGAVTTFASWYARIWSLEPITLQAFVHLLGIRRFFVDETEQLPALFDRSLKFQDEVTDALGEQVRRAVEVLIQTLDKADQDRNRELLHDVKEPELYEAALTVMMRLVFLLSAEERDLLLMGDERYEANYALSTMRMQLRKDSEEILERRWDAWSRLLAIFRAVYGGIEHENLRLPALGGSLFDPDRFPFLEGRSKGSDWRIDVAKPLPIDNRTVLLLLEAIQQFEGRALSYRALDVEQIGYVYEGLLERSVKRTVDVTLELDATKSAQSPWVTLAELESAGLDGAERLAELLQQRSGSSASRVRNDLNRAMDDALADRVLTACHGDTALRDRIKPFGHLVRTDPWGYPLVYPAGAFIVTTGSDRRETGTHYTPKSLTETIVVETLTPIAYVGPAQGMPRAEWTLKSPTELLDLKVCDPAMGSGAFLVQACRWLADRLLEAWAQAEALGSTVGADGRVVDAGATIELLPRDTETRTIVARRLIAERCLYGVDLNPLAVELAKLSIWLVTLAKGRPFGFLDHNLRCGDSLFGIHRLDQLTQLSMNATAQGQLRLFGQNIERAVLEALELRQRLREMPIRDICDVQAMARLDADARRRLEVSECIANAFIGEVFASNGNSAGIENVMASLTVQAEQAIDGDRAAIASMQRKSIVAISTDLPVSKSARRPFHWPLEFPEVFAREDSGFCALFGNPPFMGGKKISGALGVAYRAFIARTIADGRRGNADLCAFFFLRSSRIVNRNGCIGLIGASTIAEGETREVGLDAIASSYGFKIYSVESSKPWPGIANVTYSKVVMYNGEWAGDKCLNGELVNSITSSLKKGRAVNGKPLPLLDNSSRSFIGSFVYGQGFVLTKAQAQVLATQSEANSDVIFPYLIGDDFLSSPTQSPASCVINFFDWPLEKASEYKGAMEIVRTKVKPERERLKDKGYREKWWQYGRRAVNLYNCTSGLDRVLFHCFTSKYVAFAFVPTGIIYGAPHVVVAFDDFAHFSVLQSGIHDAWVREYTSYLGETPRYTPTDCFETFPFPEKYSGLDEVGDHYYRTRSELMISRGEGLTKIYNALHDQMEEGAGIVELRKLRMSLDQAVCSAYGWGDIDLDHGFHSTSKGVRFGICELARLEVLDRLLILNQERSNAAANTPTKVRTQSRMQSLGRQASTTPAQSGFDFDSRLVVSAKGANSVAVVLDFLSAHSGLHAKADIIAATGITDGQWNAAITDLIASNRVERQGERRGARYCIQTKRWDDRHEEMS